MNIIAKVFKFIAGAFLFGGVMFLAGAGWSGYRRYAMLEQWPQIDATVTECHMSSRQDTSTDSHGHSSTTTVYSLDLAFRYTVAGREYVTAAHSPFSTNLYSVMKHKADEYAPGTHHPIRYNPRDPNDIGFDVGLNFGFVFTPVLLGIFGVVFSFIGWRILGVARRAQARPCPSCGQVVPMGMLVCQHCGTSLDAKKTDSHDMRPAA